MFEHSDGLCVVCCRTYGTNGQEELDAFPNLAKGEATKAKAAGSIEVPNLQNSLVDVHVHGGTERKAELPARPSKGKDVKMV